MKYIFDSQHGHIKSLDGLRGLAILLVLFYHIFPYIRIFQIGWIGVDLFFVLSGFLITGILLDTLRHKHYWRNFIGRRILRIFPLYYFTIILFIVLARSFPSLANHPEVNYTYFDSHQWWFWSYLMNWKILDEGFWLPTEIFNIFWSLAIEEQFYIFWPFVILLFKNRIHVFIIFVLLLVTSLRAYLVMGDVWTEASVYTNTITRIDTLLIGGLLAFAIRNEKWRLFLEKYAFYIIILTMLLFLVFQFFARGFHPFNHYMLVYGYTFIYMLFGGLLLTLVQKDAFGFLKRLFESRVMVFFGRYSYAMYVYHWAIYVLLNTVLVNAFLSIWNKQAFAYVASSLTVLIIVIVISQVTWHLLEKRFLNLKKYFRY